MADEQRAEAVGAATPRNDGPYPVGDGVQALAVHLNVELFNQKRTPAASAAGLPILYDNVADFPALPDTPFVESAGRLC